MSDFVANFEASPSESNLNALKHIEFFELAKLYSVPALSGMKKADLKAVLVEFVVDELF